MDINRAIELVLTLARQNLAPEGKKRNQQIEACNTLEDFAVNHLGDDCVLSDLVLTKENLKE